VKMRNSAFLAVRTLMLAGLLAGVSGGVYAQPSPAGERDPPKCPPSPVTSRTSAGEWRHKRSRLFVVTQGSPHHRGQDVVVAAGDTQILIGKFAYGGGDKDLKDEEVEIYVRRALPCGEWELLGTASTSKDGQYGDRFGVKDDGGRVFFTIPPDRELPVGRFPVRMVVKGDLSQTGFHLFVIERATQAVIFDIDGTLTTGDKEVTREVLSRLADRKYVPEMRAEAVEVVRTLARKGYLPVYLTGRPDNLRDISRRWLVDKGFPPGVIHCTDQLRQAVPSSSGVGKFKTDFLRRLLDGGLHIVAGFGNAVTDIEAYGNVGLPKARTFIIGPHAGKQDTTALKTYTDFLVEARLFPDATTPFPQVTDW